MRLAQTWPLTMGLVAVILFGSVVFAVAQSPTKTRFGESLYNLDVEGVREALRKGANPNERYDGKGMSALGRASWPTHFLYGEKERGEVTEELEAKVIAVLDMLFEAGARLQAWDSDILFGPAMSGMPRVIKYLLDRGADPNGQDQDGVTPIIYAIKYDHPELIPILASYGGKVPAPQVEIQIRFIVAAGRSDLIALRRHLEKGAKVNDRNPMKETALVEAIRKGQTTGGNYKTVIELLRLGADPNLPGHFIGETSPLHVAVFNKTRFFEMNNGPAIVEALLKAGALVSSTTFYHNQTPLHVAAKLQNAMAAEMLLKAGAKVMPKDADGKTPLDLAESAQVINLLKKFGAKEQ